MIPAETAAKIEELLKKATPGPWEIENYYIGQSGIEEDRRCAFIIPNSCVDLHHPKNAELISVLRNSIESLLAERKRHVRVLTFIAYGNCSTPRAYSKAALSDGGCE